MCSLAGFPTSLHPVPQLAVTHLISMRITMTIGTQSANVSWTIVVVAVFAFFNFRFIPGAEKR